MYMYNKKFSFFNQWINVRKWGSLYDTYFKSKNILTPNENIPVAVA